MEPQRSGRRGRAVLVLGALAFVLLPVALPRNAPWPSPGYRAAGFVLLALVGVYAALRRAGRDRFSPGEVLLFVAVPLYVLYAGNGLLLTSGDNLATRSLGPQLLRRHTLALDGLPQYARPHYSAIRVDGRLLPSFPLGTALLGLPYSALTLAATRGDVEEVFLGRLEKHFAAVVAAAAAVLLFLAFRRRESDAVSIGAVAVFGLGTTVFSNASQAMFSVTGELLFLCLAIHLLFGAEFGTWRAASAGLALGAAFLCRPTALIAAAFLLFPVARRGVRAAAVYAAAVAVSVGAGAAWLASIYGHPLGGYGLINSGRAAWGQSLLAGLSGSLVSPSRGLLLHAPYLLFLPLALPALRGNAELRAWWTASLGATAAVVLLVSSYTKWWGGMSLGPRLLTETAPFVALLVLPVLSRRDAIGRWRVPFAAAAGFAMATQLFSSYDPNVNDWNDDVDVNPSRLWSVRESQLVAAWTPRALRRRPAPPPPVPAAGGFSSPLDWVLLGSIDDPAPGRVVKGRLLVRGWARAEGEDLRLRFALDGTPRPLVSFRRVERPDVCAAFPNLAPCARAGWEGWLEPGPGEEGPHELVATFVANDGRSRRFPPRRFVWER